MDWQNVEAGDRLYWAHRDAAGNVKVELVVVEELTGYVVHFRRPDQKHGFIAVACENLAGLGFGRIASAAVAALAHGRQETGMATKTPPTTADRLQALVTRIGGVGATSRKTGIAESTLSRYLRIGYVSAADHLVALVEADGASVGMCAGLVRPRKPDGHVIRRPRTAAIVVGETD
jgi:hypothetical protein